MNVVLPKWGLTMSEATIVRWIRSEGDTVAEGDPLVEVETDKAAAEVPAPGSGVIVRVVEKEGAVVSVGGLLATLEVPDDSGRPDSRTSAVTSTSSTPSSADARKSRAVGEKAYQNRLRKGASPRARRIAGELGVDVAGVHGTGPKGLITEADVRAAGEALKGDSERTSGLRPSRVEKLDGMRKAIAAATSLSLAQSAQLTLTREIGMAGALAFQKRLPEHLTLTDIVVATVAGALMRHPQLNAHLIGDELRFFDVVNIGLAVALEHGLVTPVIRNVCSLTLAEVGTQRRELIDKARHERLHQSNIEGGTFTITNLGGYGIDLFTPILNRPEVAILGIGTVKPRPSISGREIVVRDTCPLSLTFDHRALDGAPVAFFLADLAGLLDDSSRLEEELG